MVKVLPALSLAAATAAAVYVSSRAGQAPPPVAAHGEENDYWEQLGLGEFDSFFNNPEVPRGIRNNNPLNIRENQRVDYEWNGEHTLDIDGEFEEFTDPRYGYRAAAVILGNYAKRGVTTLQQIIATWAPASENNVQAYVSSVSKRSGIASFQHVTRGQYVALFEAMTWHENGQQPYELALIQEGVSWA